MARIRSIKPEFFLDDELAALNPLYRLLFIGLWTQADREGRLDDRPRKLKAAILPYDRVDIEKALDALVAAGFIERYETAGQAYIQVLTFLRHQCPNVKEPASTIPAPCQHHIDTPLLGTKGKEGKGTLSAREKPPCFTAEDEEEVTAAIAVKWPAASESDISTVLSSLADTCPSGCNHIAAPQCWRDPFRDALSRTKVAHRLAEHVAQRRQ